MRTSEFQFHGWNCDTYVLVERGALPWGPQDRFELIASDRAERIVVRAACGHADKVNGRLLNWLEAGSGWARSDHHGDVEQRVLRALRGVRAPQLYRRVPTLMHTAPVFAPRSPSETSLPAPSKPTSWVGIEVVSSAGAPQQGVLVELGLPDGSVRTLSTNAHGTVLAEAIEPGTCEVVLPRVDRRAWSADGEQGQTIEIGAQECHSVERGDCLATIAEHYGVTDWKIIWDHSANSDLRKKRKNPNVLLPGDAVVIPGLEVGKVQRATGAVHRIALASAVVEVELSITLRNHKGQALSGPYNLSYVFAGKKQTKSGSLRGSGELRENVPSALTTAQLTLTEQRLAYTLMLGHLDPASEQDQSPIESGARARLCALGYLARDAGPGRRGDLQAAVRAFQERAMNQSNPSGYLDGDTLAKLEELYGA